MADTIGTGSEPLDPGVPAPSAHLFRLFNADAPLEAPSRHLLAGIDEVVIGRSEAAIARREGARLFLGVADPRMSERHARIAEIAGRWVLEDAGSKNGTRVGGARVTRSVLEGGERIECGRSLFSLAFVVADRDAPLDVTAGSGLLFETLVPSFARELAILRRLAPTSASMVIAGESGTGKELAARAVHALSGRKGELVAVNCAALPAGLVEAALFGHLKGAFSGATEDRPGLFRAADGGTIFLDEIGELAPAAQAALLRVLQEREVLPVGAVRPIAVDARAIAATQRPLEALVAEGRFRADLAARLAGSTLVMPPLRERIVDLGAIIAALVQRLVPDPARVRFAPAVARALFDHEWPLNVRELEKCLERALALSGGARVELEHLPPQLHPSSEPQAPMLEDDPERARLEALLAEHRGNLSAIARALGKDRVQIRRWLARHGLDASRYRG